MVTLVYGTIAKKKDIGSNGYQRTAFTSREPLSRATVFKGTPTEYQNSDIRKWHTRHGFDKYVMSAEVIGNIHDNPELLS